MRKRTHTRRFALGGFAALVTAAVLAGSSCAALFSSQQVTDSYVRIIRPSDSSLPPSSPPAVLPSVACTRDLGGGVHEAVFGYESRAPLSLTTFRGATIGNTRNWLRNEVWRTGPSGTAAEDPAPQVLQFLPGNHPTEFAVRWSAGENVRWIINVPGIDDEPGLFTATWSITVTPRTAKPCDDSVPRHFAVVQEAAVLFPGDASSVTTDSRGALTGWALDIDITVSTRCSDGGVPLDPDLTVPIGAANLSVDPVLGTREVLTASGPVSLPITSARHFPAIDPHDSAQLTFPATDVVGRCAFPGAPEPVPEVRSTTYWLDYPNFAVSAIPDNGIRDPGDGSAEPCFPTGGDCLPTHVQVTAVAPGGVRFR